jgi:hypothetical protein
MEKKSLLKRIFNPAAWRWAGGLAAAALVYASLQKPFLKGLVDGLSIAAVAAFLMAAFRWQILKGDYDVLRYKAGSGSYAKQKEELAKQREGLGNPLAGSGLILALATLAAWLLYR